MSKYYKETYREHFNTFEELYKWISTLNDGKRKIISYQWFKELDKIVVEFAIIE